MKTLIELYDDRPQENVLSTEVFRPECTVYICSQAVARDTKGQQKLKEYFAHRGVQSRLVFLPTLMFDAQAVLEQLRQVTAEYPDCALDITGGTDAALFAAGQLCSGLDLPVFTYSRKRNRFFNIHNAAFAHELDCPVQYTVEDCFMMVGGAMRRGRVDNGVLDDYLDLFDPFFQLYLKHRRDWNRIVTYMQRVSQPPKDGPIRLEVRGDYVVKGERGNRINADEAALREMEKLGMIRGLSIQSGQSVRFRFRDEQVRAWLRDVGSVLELYVYKACRDTGLFQDVRTSAIVDWEGDGKQGNVTNELDVMATRGVLPAFISCKTCDVKTEALNELAILRDRFGGQMARAAIVTAELCSAIMRRRAAELDIDVIDLKDLRAGTIQDRLKALMQV